MKKAAWLVKIIDAAVVREKLQTWNDDYDRIIKAVLDGEEQKVTTRQCEECKKDLEENGASIVVIK